MRPVNGKKEAPNDWLSNFLSRLINYYCNVSEIYTECRSGEEMKAGFKQFNEENVVESSKNCRIMSMGVKELYPIMD